MTIEAATSDVLLATTRSRLWDVLDHLRALRARTVAPELVDEIDTIELESLRLARRLRVLGEPGLLTLRRGGRARVAELVCEAVVEVESECLRRSVGLAIEPAATPGVSWLDADMTVEVVRSVIDEVLRGATPHGTICARIEEKGTTVVIGVHFAGAGNDGALTTTRRLDDQELAERELVDGMIERVGGRIERGRTEGSLKVHLPAVTQELEASPERPVRSVASPWIFPVPTAA